MLRLEYEPVTQLPEHCICTREDFECAYCFEPTETGECALACQELDIFEVTVMSASVMISCIIYYNISIAFEYSRDRFPRVQFLAMAHSQYDTYMALAAS